jgi:hypothetical protein
LLWAWLISKDHARELTSSLPEMLYRPEDAHPLLESRPSGRIAGIFYQILLLHSIHRKKSMSLK